MVSSEILTRFSPASPSWCTRRSSPRPLVDSAIEGGRLSSVRNFLVSAMICSKDLRNSGSPPVKRIWRISNLVTLKVIRRITSSSSSVCSEAVHSRTSADIQSVQRWLQRSVKETRKSRDTRPYLSSKLREPSALAAGKSFGSEVLEACERPIWGRPRDTEWFSAACPSWGLGEEI